MGNTSDFCMALPKPLMISTSLYSRGCTQHCFGNTRCQFTVRLPDGSVECAGAASPIHNGQWRLVTKELPSCFLQSHPASHGPLMTDSRWSKKNDTSNNTSTTCPFAGDVIVCTPSYTKYPTSGWK